MRTDEWHAEHVQINMQIGALVLHGLRRPSQEQQGGTRTHTLTNSGQRVMATRPSAGPVGEAVGRSSASRQAVGTAGQAVSCDYLLCFGAELSGSRWG